MFSTLFVVVMSLSHASCQETDAQNSTMYNDTGLETVSIRGTARFRPGGSALLLSLLVKGSPGLLSCCGGAGGAGAGGAGGAGAGGAGAGGAGAGGAGEAGGAGAGGAGAGGAGGAGAGGAGGAGGTAGPTSGGASPGQATPSPSGSAGASSGSFKDYEEEGLKMHNQFRKVHGAQMMKLNQKMNEQAQAYAEKIAASGAMKHSSRSEREGQGENLSMGCSSSKGGQTVTEAVTNWYNEVCSPGYVFGQGGGPGGAGHFTQVVWNDSVELGIGKAESNQGRMKCAYIVGRYKPLGNFDQGNNSYQNNVKKGSFDRNSYCANIKSSAAFKRFHTKIA